MLDENEEIALPIKQNADKFFIEGRRHSLEKIDWTDYRYLESERERSGPGEHGERYILKSDSDIKLNEQLIKVNGYSGLVSDHVSVNRSIKDIRHPK